VVNALSSTQGEQITIRDWGATQQGRQTRRWCRFPGRGSG
jgi:hypothetical protein